VCVCVCVCVIYIYGKKEIMYYFGGKHKNRALEAGDFIEDPPN
jgi:hypothetical protein